MIQKEEKTIMKITSNNILHKATEAFTPENPLERQPPIINALASFKTNEDEAANQLVGLKDEQYEIIELLTSKERQLKKLSVVGMAGLGKTILARSVYKHPSINLHFHTRAWCCMSQSYQKETLLFDILCQIMGTSCKNRDIDREDISLKLQQNLRGRRYLIVMDDIWGVEDWNGLKDVFPDDSNGSRILFTTRHRVVALQFPSQPYDLRLLSPPEGRRLLRIKLFGGETCPPELLKITMRIANTCKGLPLALVLIAGFLKTAMGNKEYWEQAAETLVMSGKVDDPLEECFRILELSYNHLPGHLKACFLYFGVFPEYTTVPVSKLIRLWISEGFVKQPNPSEKSLEQQAKLYLNDLIGQSLVMIAKRSSRDGIKACRVHNVLREFCVAKSKEEKLLLQETRYHGFSLFCCNLEINEQQDETSACSKPLVPEFRSLFYSYKSSRGFENLMQRKWQSFWPVNGIGASPLISSGSRKAFSINLQHSTGANPNKLFNYDLILGFELLGVLDLGSVGLDSCANTHKLVMIAKLVHLRYLSVRVCTSEIPSELGHLSSLETFVLTGAIGEVILPEAFWNLPRLRHVFGDDVFFILRNCSQEFFNNFSLESNLKSISALDICHGNDVEKFLRRLPGLQKLGCRFSSSLDNHTCSILFPILDFLIELESLKLFFPRKVQCPFEFNFPKNLKKLTLSNSRLTWDGIRFIGRLNLEVLKLVNRAFEGKEWDMQEGEFQTLRFLKLDSLDIVKWTSSNDQHIPLPSLEQLVVLHCRNLEEIPPSLGEICTLQSIKMKWCSPSATDSVKQILENQRDMSNDHLNVIIVGA